MAKKKVTWNVLDMFSGAGGMSCGFHSHSSFRIIGAVDAQNGKPSSGKGSLECNKTYAANIGIKPLEADIGQLSEAELRAYLMQTSGTDKVDVLISCAPCTGFSRTIRQNMVVDDARNNLVLRSGDFVEILRPSIFVMENVGELLLGKFSFHFNSLKKKMESLGYVVQSGVHSLDKFGVPQARRRALIVATKSPLNARTLEELWDGFKVRREAVTVRAAIQDLPPIAAGETHPLDEMHVSPKFSERGMLRLRLIPKDGGSWPDLLKVNGGRNLLIPSMESQLSRGRFGPYTDIYGRLAWDKPSVTLKRECGNAGNGRYCHPEQDRHCTVREMASIQGFPKTYRFVANSVSNMYRHIGDSVPPIVSFQIAALCKWILSDVKPTIDSIILPGTHLSPSDIEENPRTAEQLPLLEAV